MFQRELLYAAGGQAAPGWPRHWGERGVLPARRGCVRAGGQDNVCGRLQPPDRSARRAGDRHIPPANAQKRKGEPGRTGKKTCRTFQKFSCRFGQSAEDSPRAWVDIDIHHGLW